MQKPLLLPDGHALTHLLALMSGTTDLRQMRGATFVTDLPSKPHSPDQTENSAILSSFFSSGAERNAKKLDYYWRTIHV